MSNTTTHEPLAGVAELAARVHVAQGAHSAHWPWRAHLVLKLLERMAIGSMSVVLPDGTERHFGSGEPHAALAIHDWALFGAVLARGDVGFAEGYMHGAWTSPDIAAVLGLFTRNRDVIERAIYGGFCGALLNRAKHFLNANTRRGSRRNIAAHYDLGNAFYRLWLDPTMTYSSAVFDEGPNQSLHQAQTAKYQRILDRLQVRPGDAILEIGCGWGGFAELAARRAQAHVTGISLSREQLAYAQTRLARADLAGRATFAYRDYRDVQGRFDHIVSIEMYEAVGERYWPSYFSAIKRMLKPGGRAIVQAITISEALFDRYRAGTDFIQQYIFPGGMLASPARFAVQAQRAGLAVADAFAFGPDYAETLRRWRASFMAQLDAIRGEGFDARFIRMWEFYLAYCEAAFDAGCTDVYQYELRA